MARNIEIKAYATDFQPQKQIAEQLSDTPVEEIHQIDTFFNVKQGRLKLREFPNADAQLIFYRRNDQAGPKLSEYTITESSNPSSLKEVLRSAYGIQAVVRKARYLYLLGRTRIHFDEVDTLGNFIELEVVLGESDSLAEGESEAQALMTQLGISSDDLIDRAYVDYFLKKIKTTSLLNPLTNTLK